MVTLLWNEFQKIQHRRFAGMSGAEKYRYLLSCLQGIPYGWGEENFESADCSGSVGIAIMGAFGYKLRTTANEFYNKIFTDGRNGVDAIFFITPKDKQHGDRQVKAGTVTHVAGLVGPTTALNAQQGGAKILAIQDLIDYFQSRGFDYKIRGLNHNAAKQYSGKLYYGADPVLSSIFVEA